MPLQNRVTPTGEIVADPARGLIMGNRGCLHGPDRRLGSSRWRSAAWICCVLDWRGRGRDPMPPGRWTALFFLDEATALAAGHRPCAYCRRADYSRFAQAWRLAQRLPSRPGARDMDQILHRERLDHRRRKRTYRAPPSQLPDGVLIRVGGRIGLLAGGQLRPWSFQGYAPPAAGGLPEVADVLTPPSTVAVIAAGYQPMLHPSAANPSTANPSTPNPGAAA
jgi:hypothetical protein